MKKLISKLNPKSFKIKLCQLLKEEAPMEIGLLENKLLKAFSDDEQSINLDSENDLKLLYFNKKRIYSILYDSDKTISLISNDSITNLSNLFYLELLIKYNSNTNNLSYSMDLICKIDNTIMDVTMTVIVILFNIFNKFI